MSFVNAIENSIINHMLRNTAWTSPGTSVYVGLISAIANGETPSVTEITGGAYARQQVQGTAAWTAPAGSGTDNVNEIAFPAATGAAWPEVVAVGIWDALTAGNLMMVDWLATTRYAFTALDAGDVFTAFGTGLANGDRVVLQAVDDSTLPTGVSADTIYFVVGVSGNTFQLSTTSGGSAIALTANGAGKVVRINPRTVNVGDVFRFPIGNLDVIVD
jgi:hypothetical protein